ncbi:MAG TPA: helix-turn-helix domain-containing protein [Actinopolymorphaceae bacterium]
MRATTSTNNILRPQEALARIDLRRYPAPPDLSRYVERFWAVHWDLTEPYEVGLIPQPCVNLTFLPVLGAEVHGVGTRTSKHPLVGRGQVFGVKFRPGGFAAYRHVNAAAFTDRSTPMREVFGASADELADAVLATPDDERRIELVTKYLRQRMTVDDTTYQQVLRAVSTMLDDRTITRVDQAAERCGMSPRTMQRLFRRYIGVGPKWVIRRYRMHDAAERLASGTVGDPAALAVELGWFDQAHFTRDFSALIGMSPVEYANACMAAGDREPTAVLTA